MQTFLPYPSFVQSAQVLDNKRLGKQRVEALQIVRILQAESWGLKGRWNNHPAIKMWRGCDFYLCLYGISICEEWVSRGFQDITPLKEFKTRLAYLCKDTFSYPTWLGSEEFHASHRSNLLRKDPIHYGQFSWAESPDLPYVWPV